LVLSFAKQETCPWRIGESVQSQSSGAVVHSARRVPLRQSASARRENADTRRGFCFTIVRLPVVSRFCRRGSSGRYARVGHHPSPRCRTHLQCARLNRRRGVTSRRQAVYCRSVAYRAQNFGALGGSPGRKGLPRRAERKIGKIHLDRSQNRSRRASDTGASNVGPTGGE
jgi:hypothetical protein